MKKLIPFLLLGLIMAIQYNLSGQNYFVNLKVFLEGPYLHPIMRTDLNLSGYLPLSQPYNITPWSYYGNEQVSSIPNINVVDWVLVELRETPGDASTAYLEDTIARKAGFLLRNGTITSMDGVTPLVFNVNVTYNLYAAVYFRNHLAVLSASPLALNGSTYSYDYSQSENSAYGGVIGHKQLHSGVWGMISGDGNGDGQINNTDKNDIWLAQTGLSGYKSGDFSLDGQVNNADKINFWAVNSGISTQLPGPWTCGEPFVDDRDGRFYNSVVIGGQCWMAENLNVNINKFCYQNDGSYCDIYGGLYSWNDMMQYTTKPCTQGICPDGWVIPSKHSINLLEAPLNGASGAGAKMKEAGYSHWSPPNVNANNSSGFTGLPGGYRYNTDYGDLGYYGRFWISSQDYNNIDIANYCFLSTYNGILNFGTYDKDNALSVRCIRNMPPIAPFNYWPVNNSSNVKINAGLKWSSVDPEYEEIYYDVFFGTTNPPPLISGGQLNNEYNPGILSSNHTYYWKIIVYDSTGHLNEGPIWTFTTGTENQWQCGDALIDTRDEQVYGTVQINGKCWMAENINYGIKINNGSSQLNNNIAEKYCYDDMLSHCENYGGLYQWAEAMQYSSGQVIVGLCPGGWHVPSQSEWTDFIDFLGGPSVAGGKMKETGYIHWKYPNLGATNLSGFNALPAGAKNPNGPFDAIDQNVYFWSSNTGGMSNMAFNIQVSHLNAGVSEWDSSKLLGLSLRCIKN